jgi:DNA polymerase-3 subunit alpha
MQKHLRSLKPDAFADLIAMNALYRPGPLQYIPDFIARKHGKQEISYDLDDMKEYLEETYGITVYQEQVMLLSQKLAGFTKGEADALRKGMGKKKKEVIDAMFPKFVEGCEKNGHPKEKVEKIWKDWEAFASYAFNKSHSTCYAFVAFQTAYLKANYPAEFMAAVLSNNMNDIKQVTLFMDECRRMGIAVLGPSVNESQYRFTVNPAGEIRFGMGAIKGVGGSAVDAIVRERKENGPYSDFYDFIRRVDLKIVNKRTLESLAQAGGFDSFEQFHRSQFFMEDERGSTFLETAMRYGNAVKDSENSSQQSLFGDDISAEIQEPQPAEGEEWGTLRRLSLEKEVVGVYISGHPLDDYRTEIESFCTPGGLSRLHDLEKNMGYELKFAGMVTEAAHRISKTNKPYGSFTLEDYNDSYRFMLFGEDYVRCREYLVDGWFLFVKGKVQKRRRGDLIEPEFKVHQVELLSELREKRAKELKLRVELGDINEEIVEKLEELFTQNKGKCRLNIEIVDERMKLNMPSRGMLVDPNNDVLQELRNMPELEVKLSD